MSPSRHPSLSFGMIVFNGAEFLKNVLESVYDAAHEIIIVEGADRNAWNFANPDGSSTDDTVSILRSYPDPDKKIHIIQGKWQDKNEACNEYLKHVTGDYVWHLDDDEIYTQQDIESIRTRLAQDPSITAVSLFFVDFFKGFSYVTEPVESNKRREAWRIFKFSPNAHYVTHRPPTLVDSKGTVMNTTHPLRGEELARDGIFFYHFSYITDRQVREKMAYHEHFRLREEHHGIPFLPLLASVPWLRRAWLFLWHQHCMDPLRKRLDGRFFNYRYLENVWNRWDRERELLEKTMSALPAYPKVRTAPFIGELPEAVKTHPLYQHL